MSQIDIYNAIFAKLTADQSVGSFYDDVGGRIFLTEAGQSETLPLCVFSLVTDIPQRFFGPNDLVATFQIDLFGNAETSTPEALVATNAKLIALLDRVIITMANHVGAVVFADDRGIVTKEEDAWRIMSTWRTLATEI